MWSPALSFSALLTASRNMVMVFSAFSSSRVFSASFPLSVSTFCCHFLLSSHRATPSVTTAAWKMNRFRFSFRNKNRFILIYSLSHVDWESTIEPQNYFPLTESIRSKTKTTLGSDSSFCSEFSLLTALFVLAVICLILLKGNTIYKLKDLIVVKQHGHQRTTESLLIKEVMWPWDQNHDNPQKPRGWSTVMKRIIQNLT